MPELTTVSSIDNSICPQVVKLRLLDLYCCAGGASKGYSDAGFEVVGCDIQHQPHYTFEFYQDDALHALDTLLSGKQWNGYSLSDFAAIHASPECKGYTICNLSPKDLYEKQIDLIRDRLKATVKLYVIENVMNAKKSLRASLLLCGSMFDLRTQRHRLFETNIPTLLMTPPCNHNSATIAVYGHSVWDSSLLGTPRKDGRSRPDSVSIKVGREVMGIDWMNIEELAEAIPPAYTRWLGKQLLREICPQVVENHNSPEATRDGGVA